MIMDIILKYSCRNHRLSVELFLRLLFSIKNTLHENFPGFDGCTARFCCLQANAGRAQT